MLTGAEQHAVFGMTNDESTDALPEQQQRIVVFLVFGPNERPAQLEGGRQTRDQTLVVAEQGPCVEAVHAMPGRDLISPSDSIGADDLTPAAIPREEVQVAIVERVQIQCSAGPFADGPVCLFAQPADLSQRRRYL